MNVGFDLFLADPSQTASHGNVDQTIADAEDHQDVGGDVRVDRRQKRQDEEADHNPLQSVHAGAENTANHGPDFCKNVLAHFRHVPVEKKIIGTGKIGGKKPPSQTVIDTVIEPKGKPAHQKLGQVAENHHPQNHRAEEKQKIVG